MNKTTHIKTSVGWLSKTCKEDWVPIHEDYIVNNKSIIPFSIELGINQATLRKYFKLFEFEQPTKEQIQQKRIKKNRENCLIKHGVPSYSQTSQYKEKVRKTCLEKYGVESTNQLRTVKEKKKQTFLEKYGVENPSQSKDIRDKSKQTCLEKYGVEYSLQSEDIRNKSKQTCLERYGVENPNQHKDIRDKSKQTCLERYGVENPNQSRDIRDKSKQTCLERYGVENPSQCTSIKNKIIGTNISRYGVKCTLQLDDVKAKIELTCLHKYGVKNPLQSKDVRNKMLATKSAIVNDSINSTLRDKGYILQEDYSSAFTYDSNKKYIAWKKYKIRHTLCGKEFKKSTNNIKNIKCPYCYPAQSVDELNYRSFILGIVGEVSCNNRQVIKPYELDMYIGDKSVAFEYNSNYFHSALCKQKNYHKDKTDLCLDKGIRLYHIWDYNEDEIVKSLIKVKLNRIENKRFARKLKIKEVKTKERRTFFDENHLHGDTGSTFTLGLYENGDLVQCISFRKHKEGMEIARFATKLNYAIVGGFSKLLKYSENHIRENYPHINKIITYCDRDWTPDYKDSVYYKNGFTLVKDSGPMLKYYNSKKKVVESREKYQKHKLAQMFPDAYSDHLTADEILYKKGIYPIYNSGNWKFELNC